MHLCLCSVRRQHRTVSIAVSAAAIDNASSTELANAMAGQIARTVAIFNVDEIIVIDESSGPEYAPSKCLLHCAAFCRLF